VFRAAHAGSAEREAPRFKMLKATMCPRPISCSRFSFALCNFPGKSACRAAVDAILCFRCRFESGESALDDESREFSPSTLAKTM